MGPAATVFASSPTPTPQPNPRMPLSETGVVQRRAPPSPAHWAEQRPSAMPRLTAAEPMRGAAVPVGHNVTSRAAPAPVARGQTPQVRGANAQPAVVLPGPKFTDDEPPTEMHRPLAAAALPATPQPLPSHGLPPELLATQPGIPGPYARKKATPGPVKSLTLEPSPPSVILEDERLTPKAEDAGDAARKEEPTNPPVSLPNLQQLAAFAEESVETNDVLASPAPLWARLAAWLIDAGVVALIVGGLLGAAALFGAKSAPSMVKALAALAVPGTALGVLFVLAYTTLFAALWKGRTLGRRLVGIRLVDSTGDAPSLGRALVRAALALVSCALFFAGFWLALFDRHGQTLHDKLTGTFVVRLLRRAP